MGAAARSNRDTAAASRDQSDQCGRCHLVLAVRLSTVAAPVVREVPTELDGTPATRVEAYDDTTGRRR